MFSQLLERYRRYYIGLGNMESTADQACEKINRILNSLYSTYGVRFEEMKFSGLTSPVLMAWYDDLVSAGRAMSTRNNYVALLNPFMKWAVIIGALDKRQDPRDYDETPVYEVLEIHKLPREENIPASQRKQRSFTKEQLMMLMDSIKGRNSVRNRAILALFIHSGIRESELCSLTLSSVLDQPRGRIYLRRKGGAWKHTEVGEAFYPYLEAYLKTRGDLDDKNSPLFLSNDGGHLTRNAVWRMFHKYETSLGLTSGVHIFRHTVISNIDKNSSAGAARDIANHTTLNMTNRYAHTTPQERAAAINNLDWSDGL